jgi:hypothetical protein
VGGGADFSAAGAAAGVALLAAGFSAAGFSGALARVRRVTSQRWPLLTCTLFSSDRRAPS